MARIILVVLVSYLLIGVVSVSGMNFYNDVDLTWGGDKAKIMENGSLLVLNLDKNSGSGFQSKAEYLFGRIDIKIKVVPGNSAGTVTAYYLSSQGSAHDEIDFEFLGNVSGEPYTLHTNVFSQGQGNREQQFYLWFDPRLDFHTYSLIWNPQTIIFYVDETPIRVFKNQEDKGVPYPKNQTMRLYSSLWDAEDWATRGGLVKTDWSQAPFTASYRAFSADACIFSKGKSSCTGDNRPSGRWWDQSLDSVGMKKLKWVKDNYMIYDYCQDSKKVPTRFSSGVLFLITGFVFYNFDICSFIERISTSLYARLWWWGFLVIWMLSVYLVYSWYCKNIFIFLVSFGFGLVLDQI